MAGRGSLARQLLGWQVVIVVTLLAAVAVFSAVQARSAFQTTEGRRMLSVAEDVAATPGVRAALADPLRYHQLPPFAESARSLSGADGVLIALPALRVLTSPDPTQVGGQLPIGDSTVQSGRSWVGEVGPYLVAHVPVIGDNGTVIGIVAAEADRPSFVAGVVHSPGEALLILGVATVLGVGGSLLVARRVKRQTLGLEPTEIAGLVEHREAMLHGIKEGVVGLDQQGRVTLVNDHARVLLSLPDDAVGRPVTDFEFNDRALDVLSGRAEGADQIVLRRGRVLIMNRMPIGGGDGGVGSVVTLRDRTEIVALRHELDANRATTDTLRAQAHEFSNRLHTIAGLIELGEYDEVRRFVDRVSHTRSAWQSEVSSHVADPAVAALLVAKSSLAAEQAVGLRLAPSSRLGAVDEHLSADLVTVLGNLVDNALDSVRGGGGWIEVALTHEGGVVLVVVCDSGPGVAPDLASEVFRHGFTTKAAEEGGQRGLGLALTRQTCLSRGGTIEVDGAVFTARLPEVPA
ncbi:sensor histidine kinase [Actinokineospora cianjurensis]|uniref:Sensor histidine kinase regulating citrate/malate metabolism n=1 Tax=Actinokineospora cianjurensis TaxID=585224 RepID=A0A421B7H7_9PSEU|nr:sensor histidine kinase [Actinokineospora cianjurensis]RLK60456.1 sensor histidine kinase regulating citrate/malate metabolism [Actinokineospora cianjurensis]